MKYQFIIITLFTISCGNNTSQTYEWIRSHSSQTIFGANLAVEDRRKNENDSLILVKMEHISRTFTSIYDSFSDLSKKQILKKTEPLIGDVKFDSSNIKEFFTLSEHSSDQDFKLQLALLEYELLSNCVKQIGLRDFTFDTLELRFTPIQVNNARVLGELQFIASSNNLEGYAKMYVNDKQIEIDGGTGLVDIPRDELKNGMFNAKIEFEYANSDLEADIQVLKE